MATEAEASSAVDEDALLTEILRDRTVRPLFQPVVHLDTAEIVGFEALARGPAGGALERPDQLFARARDAGLVAELDWLCRDLAVDAARDGGLHFPLSLFVNADPAALGREGDEELWRAYRDLRCYTEITERDLSRHPAELLRAVDHVREQDWGIALDDIGAVPESLALMPLLRPDVLKLDIRLLARRLDRQSAGIVHAVLAQAAATGAVVVAEGIEDEQRLEVARGYGVEYGQGFLLGRPAPLPDRMRSPHNSIPMLPRATDKSFAPSPYAALATATGSRAMSRDRLLELMRQLIGQASSLQPQPLVLLTLPPEESLTAELRAALARLTTRAPLVAVLGGSPELASVPGIRWAPNSSLDAEDPATTEMCAAVVSSFYGAAVAAQVGLSGSSEWDGVFTLDRALAVTAATLLFTRIPSSADDPPQPPGEPETLPN